VAKTYTLQGPIVLEGLNNVDALEFVGAVINAIPSYSMGSASMNIRAQGPAGSSDPVVSGASLTALKTSLAAATDTLSKSPADITYDVRGQVNLVGLSLEDGIGVVDAALHAIPEGAGVWARAVFCRERADSKEL
jgi:hypothetical protein